MTLLADVMDALGDLYPWELARQGDGSGLLVGSLSSGVRRVMCSVDLTTEIVQSAVEADCELLVTHHPHVLTGRAARWDWSTPAGALAKLAVEGGLNIVACRGNADSAEDGTADLMARRLRLEDAGPLEPAPDVYMARIVVFVPPEALDDVSAVMAGAGAGVAGDYTRCSFTVTGRGTFVPGPGARPYTGEPGVLNVTDELRLEMAAPSFRVPAVVSAILGKHPYEEVAYDVYRTEGSRPWGRGRVGELPGERVLREIMDDLAGWCGSENPVLTGEPETEVARAAVSPGNADDLVERAYCAGAGLLVAGEVGWHKTLEACDAGMAVLCLGHLESERPLVPRMVEGMMELSRRRGLGLSVEGYRDQKGRWG